MSDSRSRDHEYWRSIGIPNPRSPAGRHFPWTSIGLPAPNSPFGQTHEGRQLLANLSPSITRVLPTVRKVFGRYAPARVCSPTEKSGLDTACILFIIPATRSTFGRVRSPMLELAPFPQ
jgi:hypothetical protein